MQHPVTKRWHCDDCGEIYQQKEHLAKHQTACKRHQAVLAERAKAEAPAAEPKADPPPFDPKLAAEYEAKKAAKKGKKE